MHPRPDIEDRVRKLNGAPLREGAEYVLYWAQMNRRVDSNHGLAYAAIRANELKLPVLFYEGLTCSYPYANDRLHTFILEGVPETERRLRQLGIGYIFHLRRRRHDPKAAPYELAANAALVVTDDYPVFVAAQHNASVPEKIGVAYYAVDSSCIVPMNCLPKQEYTAYTMRPKIHRLLPKYSLETMLYIHDRWALDGRDPNTYANILWLFGLHDRPWQERPIFGMIRYMSLEGMRRKTDVDAYIREVS